jgi:hypothetical protein
MLLGVPLRVGEGVFLFQQQPLVAFAAIFHQDDSEFALELLAVQAELEIAALELRLRRKIAHQLVCAAVP